MRPAAAENIGVMTIARILQTFESISLVLDIQDPSTITTDGRGVLRMNKASVT